jgi:putative DNA primase/helicase
MKSWQDIEAEGAAAEEHFAQRREDGDPGWNEPERDGANRPVIVIRAGEMHSMATAAEGALIEMGAPLYVRGENIVRPVLDQMPASKGRRTKVARLATIGKDAMLDHLSRCADWSKFNARKKSLVPADPPKDVASILLSREGEWRFPRIAGVITTPTLRADGSILSMAGYDEATQLLLLDPPPLPPMADKPTEAHAEAALDILDKLLDEFPFVDQASRSAALSGLITPIVRGAMDVAPLHATTAPVAGSGKSYINDIAAAISTGDRAPVFSAAVKEDELEKRIFSALHAGQPIVCLDNVNGALGGDFLCQAIERPVVQSRVLGVSKVPKIESRACFFATGNNIRLVGDMTRRVILCSLDPQMERPELREFEASPFDTVLANRGKYIAAALTICRAYIVAGCPGVLPALASFEDWSRIVRSALVWLGRDDPIKTMEAARDDDPVTSGLRAIFTFWYHAANGKPRTTGELKTLAEERDPHGNRIHSDLFQALVDMVGDSRGDIDTRRLGQLLGAHKNRILGDLKLTFTDNAHSKQKLWAIEWVDDGCG